MQNPKSLLTDTTKGGILTRKHGRRVICETEYSNTVHWIVFALAFPLLLSVVIVCLFRVIIVDFLKRIKMWEFVKNLSVVMAMTFFLPMALIVVLLGFLLAVILGGWSMIYKRL